MIEGPNVDPGLGQRVGVGLPRGSRRRAHHDPLQGAGEPGDRHRRRRRHFREHPGLHVTALLIGQRDHGVAEPLHLDRMQPTHLQQ
jgi:hypothetical protein